MEGQMRRRMKRKEGEMGEVLSARKLGDVVIFDEWGGGGEVHVR